MKKKIDPAIVIYGMMTFMMMILIVGIIFKIVMPTIVISSTEVATEIDEVGESEIPIEWRDDDWNLPIEYFDEDTDLQTYIYITEDQFQEIIDYWLQKSGTSDTSIFAGDDIAAAFIMARDQTGLDPVFLLALAASESGWDVSENHRQTNLFSINMTDSGSPEDGYIMNQDGYYEGIIIGAWWIYDHYYCNGQITLRKMITDSGDGHIYCTDSDTWMRNITNIVNTSYSLVYEEWAQ